MITCAELAHVLPAEIHKPVWTTSHFVLDLWEAPSNVRIFEITRYNKQKFWLRDSLLDCCTGWCHELREKRNWLSGTWLRTSPWVSFLPSLWRGAVDLYLVFWICAVFLLCFCLALFFSPRLWELPHVSTCYKNGVLCLFLAILNKRRHACLIWYRLSSGLVLAVVSPKNLDAKNLEAKQFVVTPFGPMPFCTRLSYRDTRQHKSPTLHQQHLKIHQLFFSNLGWELWWKWPPTSFSYCNRLAICNTNEISCVLGSTGKRTHFTNCFSSNNRAQQMHRKMDFFFCWRTFWVTSSHQ